MIAAAVPSLVAAPALAGTPSHAAPRAGAATAPSKPAVKSAAKPTVKPAAKPSKAASAKPSKKQAQPAAKEPARPAAKEPLRAASKKKATGEHGNKTKKRAARAAEPHRKSRKRGERNPSPKPCLNAPVTIDRGGLESQSISLLDCLGTPIAAGRDELSLLARPWGTARPRHLHMDGKQDAKASAKTKRRAHPDEVAPGIRLLDEGLLVRLQAVTHKFPGRTISLVSGYRPQSQGSLHQLGRALDLRVAGVSNEDLVAFCKTLPDTGCGYYPNSSFVHMDVRKRGTGSVSWIDASGPGEAPRYVKQWPLPDEPEPVVPPADEVSDEARDVVDPWDMGASTLPPAGVGAPAAPESKPATPPADKPAKPEEEAEPNTPQTI